MDPKIGWMQNWKLHLKLSGQNPGRIEFRLLSYRFNLERYDIAGLGGEIIRPECPHFEDLC